MPELGVSNAQLILAAKQTAYIQPHRAKSDRDYFFYAPQETSQDQ